MHDVLHLGPWPVVLPGLPMQTATELGVPRAEVRQVRRRVPIPEKAQRVKALRLERARTAAYWRDLAATRQRIQAAFEADLPAIFACPTECCSACRAPLPAGVQTPSPASATPPASPPSCTADSTPARLPEKAGRFGSSVMRWLRSLLAKLPRGQQ